jgi:hypothetical protein
VASTSGAQYASGGVVRRDNILHVNPAKDRRDPVDRLDDLVGILSRQAQRKAIHTCERLENQAIAIHDGWAGAGPMLQRAQDGRAISDNGEDVRLDRQRPLRGWVFVDRNARSATSWTRTPAMDLKRSTTRCSESALAAVTTKVCRLHVACQVAAGNCLVNSSG